MKKEKMEEGLKETMKRVDSLTATLEKMGSLPEQVASLADSSWKLATRLESVEGKMAKLEETEPETDESIAVTHDEAIEENARLHEDNEKLLDRNKYLEGDAYQNKVIQAFLRDLDADNFLAIGLKLEFLESSEVDPKALANVNLEDGVPLELPLEDNRILCIQANKPEDMTGWERSETQNVYVKIKTREE